MNYIRIVILLLLSAFFLPSSAQRGGRAKRPAPQPVIPPSVLMEQYKFAEAAEAYDKEIAEALSTGNAVEELMANKQRALLGQDMLRATEKVVFIDSFRVARTEFFSYLQECMTDGSLASIDKFREFLPTNFTRVGQATYLNDFGDHLFLTASTESEGQPNCQVYAAWKSGDGWTDFEPLPCSQEELGMNKDYPFLMPDGTTLYFAAEGPESLGGYDLFITRYDTESKSFLKSENLGMPYNSPANDYLLILNEEYKIGLLASDRRQPQDSVAFFVFIPPTTKEYYDEELGVDTLVAIAQLSNLECTQTDLQQVADARQRYAAFTAHQVDSKANYTPRRYVITSNIVYNSLQQFRNPEAAKLAAQADSMQDKIKTLSKTYDSLQLRRYRKLPSNDLQLAETYKELTSLRREYKQLCKAYRKAEKSL